MSIASATWISTPITAPYANEVIARVTASFGMVFSSARKRPHVQTTSQTMTSRSAVPATARNGRFPVKKATT